MKLRFETIDWQPHQSLRVLSLHQPTFDAPWHCHPEWELTWIQAGSGQRFVGTSIEAFSPGDLVLLGPELPHVWHSESPSPGPPSLEAKAKAIVVQFPDTLPGKEFLALPEAQGIRRLLQDARQGLAFEPSSLPPSTLTVLEHLPQAPPFSQILGLLDVLERLAHAQKRPLSEQTFARRSEQDASERLGKAYAFLAAHFHEPITLADIAAAAAMSPCAFSRFFKRLSRRNVWETLTALRIHHASRLLRESQLSITEIALQSGFETLSSFHRSFQRTHHKTPTTYRRLLQAAEPD